MNWYVIYVRGRYEKKVLALLKSRQVECFLPLTREVRQWTDRKKVIEEPLIRGYLFVRIDYRNYYGILQLPGVLNFVCFEKQPAVVPDYQIEDLKIFARETSLKLEVSSEAIRKGKFIRVIEGPFCGVVGEIIQLRGKRKIVVRIKALGCSILAELGKNEVAPYAQSEAVVA